MQEDEDRNSKFKVIEGGKPSLTDGAEVIKRVTFDPRTGEKTEEIISEDEFLAEYFSLRRPKSAEDEMITGSIDDLRKAVFEDPKPK